MFLLYLYPCLIILVFSYLCFPTGFRHGDLCQVCLDCHGYCWLWEHPQFSVAWYHSLHLQLREEETKIKSYSPYIVTIPGFLYTSVLLVSIDKSHNESRISKFYIIISIFFVPHKCKQKWSRFVWFDTPTRFEIRVNSKELFNM